MEEENQFEASAFGGNVASMPDEQEPDGGYLSLEDDPEPPVLLSIADESSRPVPAPDKADQRAEKINFALGSDSPGVISLANDIKAGAEDSLRQRLAQQRDIQDRNLKLDIIREKAASGDTSPQTISDVGSLSRYEPTNDPATITEKLFAESVVKGMFGLGVGVESVLGAAFAKDPAKTADTARVTQEIIHKQEIAKTAYEDYEQIAQEQSWVGWGIDLATQFIPGYTSAKLWDEKTASDSYLKGSTIRDRVSYYWSLSPSDMHKQLRADLAGLSKDDPSMAAELARATISYSKNDQFLDNAFTTLDIATAVSPVTLLKGARGAVDAIRGARATGVAARAVEGAAEAATATEATNVLKGGIKANATLNMDAGDFLTAVGDVTRGARANAYKRISEVFGKADPMNESSSLSKQMMTIFNPDVIARGANINLSAERTQRIIDTLKRNNDNLFSKLTDAVKVGRLPEEALNEAFVEAEGRIAKQYNHIEDAILDVRRVRPEDSAANVGGVVVKFGATDGVPFTSIMEAQQVAKHAYGLHDGSYKIIQHELGYTIDVVKHLDETSKGVRDALITTDNTSNKSIFNAVFGRLRTADDKISKFQRENAKTATHGLSALQEAFKDQIKEIRGMPVKERNDLNRIMEKNKFEMNVVQLPNGDVREFRGKYYDTVEELEQSYRQTLQRNPSENEVRTYFTMKQMNDYDWVMRNLGRFRDLSRQGIEKFKILGTVEKDGRQLGAVGKDFHGKFVDDLPWHNPEDTGVVIHAKGQEPQYLNLHSMAGSGDHRTKIKELLDQGYRIIQTGNPLEKHFGERFGPNDVGFIVTKDFENYPLDWAQVPYRPGWHTEYPQNWYVKQPKIRTAGEAGAPKHLYEGDVTAMGFETEAKAKEYAGKMDFARQLLRDNKQTELKAFLEKNLPFTPKKFEALFTPDANGEVRFSMNESFLHSESGSNTADRYGDVFKQSYEGFQDKIRSSYNLMANTDKKFLGQRDESLWTVAEEGTELNPVFKLNNAPEIDPMKSVGRSMANVMRNRFFADHKIQAVESWVKEFGHLLQVNSPEDLAANPVWYIHNGNFKPMSTGNGLEMRAAKETQAAIQQLLGTEDGIRTTYDALWAKAHAAVSKRMGDDGVATAEYMLRAEKDPVRFMRGVVFHTQIGLFNVAQLWQNMATMTNTIGIAGPVNGFAGAAATLPARWALLNEAHIPAIAQKMRVFGWSPEHFTEMISELKKTGKATVEGEVGWRDDIAPPTLFESKAGVVLDAGTSFFKEGERMTRVGAFATAYKEWRSANPNTVMTDAIRRGLIERSDIFGGNMTRASNAAWQQGVGAVPAQFLSYHTRLAEQMLGGRLTAGEKASLLATNSLIWGLPVGALGSSGLGALAGGQINMFESFRNYALDHNLPWGEKQEAAIQGGLTDLIATLITGQKTDLASRIGPGGGSAIRQILMEDKSFIEVLFGAAGSKGGSMLETTQPVLHYLTSPFRSGEDSYKLTVDDIADFARNIKSVDSSLNLFYGLSMGKVLAKNGAYVADTNKLGAVMGFITGATPRDASDFQLMQKMAAERGDNVKKVLKDVQEDAAGWLSALENGDQSMADVYYKRVNVKLKLADLTPMESKAAFTQIVGRNINRYEKVRWDFIYKKAPWSTGGERQDNEELKRKATQE